MAHKNLSLQTPSRRTVLKAASASAASAVGLMGFASAKSSTEDLSSGDCVVTETAAGLYEGCSAEDTNVAVPEGITGTVADVCDDQDLIGVVWDSSRYEDGYVPADALNYCMGIA